jgi:DNA polymerase elongation subunit (family B)
MVKDKLLGRDDLVEKEVEHFKEMIYSGEMSIVDLAKGEFISKSPAQYQADVLKTGKGRRASLEASLQMNPPPEVGDKVLYYITPSASPRDADWKRARPISLYDKETAPYDAKYYADKIDDWRERFSDLFGSVSGQGELF